MDQMIVLIGIATVAVAGAVLVSWGMWLDHNRHQKLLEIVAAMIAAGQAPPPELLSKLTGQNSEGSQSSQASRSLLRSINVFLAMAVAFLLAATGAGGKAEEALLLVAAISGVTTLALLVVYTIGRRVGL